MNATQNVDLFPKSVHLLKVFSGILVKRRKITTVSKVKLNKITDKSVFAFKGLSILYELLAKVAMLNKIIKILKFLFIISKIYSTSGLLQISY